MGLGVNVLVTYFFYSVFFCSRVSVKLLGLLTLYKRITWFWC